MVEPTPDFPLGRLTTIGTGGRAEFFARAGTPAELGDLLGWAAARQLGLNVVGSGSNLLVSDDGVDGLVVKLDRELARIEPVDDQGLLVGGGARLPSVAARAATLGLSGIEFGVNIPGTVGGAVRMNANAYGGALGRVLEWVEIHTADGVSRRTAAELAFSYRASNVRSDEVVGRALLRLEAAPSSDVRARLEEMRTHRHAAQPKGIRTFGSTFKNPEGSDTAGLLLARAGAGGLRVGAARFSPKHANFVENVGGASTADVVGLMAEGRRLVFEVFGVELEPEVQTLGPVDFPWKGAGR
ncbi:MAG TPA: UDP-N-acetylmuramate dehydrogenase [Solirubrobacteraceae bacterium]|jgi:UDP-N-acetylmuramate dehydrogenase|nr:UDP-N-acetylmuramate dehydrogenase [Solirubrobacteraceae bacterium]